MYAYFVPWRISRLYLEHLHPLVPIDYGFHGYFRAVFLPGGMEFDKKLLSPESIKTLEKRVPWCPPSLYSSPW